MENQFNIKEVKVHRTLEGTIFETVFAIMAIVVWGLIILMLNQAPDIVPTHFDASGKPNAYGSPTGIVIPCIIVTIAAIGLMVIAYFPRHINMPFKVTNIRQVELTIRMTRITGLIFLVLTLAIGWTSLGSINHGDPNAIPILTVVGLLFAVIIVFTILIRKAK